MPLIPKDLPDPVVRCGICDAEYSIPIDGCPNQCYRQTKEIPFTHVNVSEFDTNGFLCVCGNTPDSQGAYCCDSNGDYLEDYGDDWPGKLYRCGRCGIVFDEDTGKIIAQQTTAEDWHDRVDRVCPELDGTK